MLDLQKGDLLNLTKDYSKLNKIDLGLGWDVSTTGRSWDLDASAIMMNDKNEIINTVYYGNKNVIGVRLNGDNLTGAGDGDDEIISVNLSKIPENVTKIGFFVNIFSAGDRDFSKIKNAYIRMVNKDTNKEVCKYNLNEDGKGYNAFHFANLEKVGNEWQFIAVGTGTNGGISELKGYFAKNSNVVAPRKTAMVSEPKKKTLLDKILGR